MTQRIPMYFLVALVLVAGCSHDEAQVNPPPPPDPELRFTPDPQPNPPPPGVAAMSVQSVKLVRPDGEKIELTARPVPLCSKIEVTLSGTANPEAFTSLFSVSSGESEVTGGLTWSQNDSVVTFTPSSCFSAATSYNVDIALAPEADRSFVTKTHGDLTGDGIPDLVALTKEVPGTIAYIFVYSGANLSGTFLATTAHATIRLPKEDGDPGRGLKATFVDDVDGDGYDDLLTSYILTSSSRGSALLFRGRTIATEANITPSHALATIVGASSGDEFGSSAAALGDMNGDGFADFAVGAQGRSSDRGAVFLFSGKTVTDNGAQTTLLHARSLVQGETAGDEFGRSISSKCDVNRDGLSELIVGANSYGAADDGAVYIYNGAPLFASTPQAQRISMIQGTGTDFNVGLDVRCVRGLPGAESDGIVVGSTSRAYVFSGEVIAVEGTRSTGDALALVSAPAAGGFFAYGNTAIGDINGDGITEVLMTYVNFGDLDDGALFLLDGARLESALGEIDIESDDEVLIESSAEDSMYFGTDVAVIGDITGDGIPEIAVGSMGDGDPMQSGSVFVYSGTSFAEEEPQPLAKIDYPRSSFAHFGEVVAGGGLLW